MVMILLKWIVFCILVVPTLAIPNGDTMHLTISDSDNFNSAFNLMTSCFISNNYSNTLCNANDTTILNQCGNNSNGYLICCKSPPVCYNSIDVVFMSGIYTLTESYTFVYLQNIRFSGSPVGPPSVIKCNNTENSDADSGIKFVQVNNITIEHLTIIGCGMKHTSTSTSNDGEFITHLSAVYIQNSTNLLVSNVNISNSNGTGLSIVDTNGTINITDSFFSNNKAKIPVKLSTVISGGGGIYIEYTGCAPGVGDCNSSEFVFANNSVITIENCVFEFNHALYDFNNSLTDTLDDRTFIGFGAGGGLSLQLNSEEIDAFVHVTILSSNFSNNKATNGGGLSLYCRYNTSNIHLNISRCNFVQNSATYFGGGGVMVGFVIFSPHERVTHNTIIIDGCSFERNRSPVVGGGLSWHGGTELLGTRQTNYFAVSRSSFVYNQALYGSAIQINKEFFELVPNGTFLNLYVDSCNFTHNSANFHLTSSPTGVGAVSASQVNFSTNAQFASVPSGVGVVSASKVNIQFSGHTDFSSNNSTALVGDESELGFHNNSVTVFHDNHGFLGGAVLLMSSSRIIAHFNSTLIFLRNVAVINGGAIYVHFATLFDYLISFSCFIRYYDQNIAPDEWHTRFIFVDNKAADNQHNSMFTTTLRPCRNTYSKGFLGTQPFCFYSSATNKSRDPITYNDLLDDRRYCKDIIITQDKISTASYEFCNVSNETVYVVPGKVHDLNVCIVDELDNQILNSQFIATCINTCTHDHICANPSYDSSQSFSNGARVLPDYRTNEGSVQIAGSPGSVCHLQLQTIEDFQITGAWSIQLLNCPPGFVFNSKDDVCTCLTNREHVNPVILGCEQTVFQAYYNPFYWIGYRTDDANDLLVGACPYEYCYQDAYVSGNQLLPEIANKVTLDKFVCGGSSRTGTLCGKCLDGYSVTLNSPTFACNKCDDEHKLGILYLLLSYIVPVTILFFIIMKYDIRITTGPIGSFIFFSQIISSEFHYILIYSVNANNPTTLNIFNAILGIYSISNLDFFNYDIFRYCLFQRAGTIDIVAFELLLSLYPVSLIIIYALIRRYDYIGQNLKLLKRLNRFCQNSRCFKIFTFPNKSITHAICAFLVICFAKINLQAFTILIPAEITYINEDKVYKKVVYLQGDLEYFREMPHTLYALGAILFIIVVIGIPTLILLLYPLMMQIVVYFGWGETKPVLLINKCLMIDRLKPVLDSFQGNYKDNLQFFAGLQIFFYRTVFFLIVVTTTPDIDDSLLLIAGYFMVVALIHNLVMPFKQYVDNAVYTMMYTLLLTITIIELYSVTSGMFVEALIWLQIILCAVPLCCFATYCTWRLMQVIARLKIFSRFEADKTVIQNDISLGTLPGRLQDQDNNNTIDD